jgi:hypothetical protein
MFEVILIVKSDKLQRQLLNSAETRDAEKQQAQSQAESGKKTGGEEHGLIRARLASSLTSFLFVAQSNEFKGFSLV